MPQKLAPCGTAAAYVRHLYRDEPVDEACRKANAAAKRGQGHTRVRDRARTALVHRYPDEYAELVASRPGDPRRWDKARADLARRHEHEFRRLMTDEFAKQALEDA